MRLFSPRFLPFATAFLAPYAAVGDAQNHDHAATTPVQVEYVHPEKFSDVRDQYLRGAKLETFI